ncbi:hypothetical protein [Bradyrhizobium sp. CCBAU 53338]|nr:hypothetical protein [Bradyrhizobium sp. CCBAU 53338]
MRTQTGMGRQGNADDNGTAPPRRLFLLRLTILVAFCTGLAMSPGL